MQYVLFNLIFAIVLLKNIKLKADYSKKSLSPYFFRVWLESFLATAQFTG
jgi:hypothetical protein